MSGEAEEIDRPTDADVSFFQNRIAQSLGCFTSEQFDAVLMAHAMNMGIMCFPFDEEECHFILEEFVRYFYAARKYAQENLNLETALKPRKILIQ